MSEDQDKVIEQISTASKQFYSAGATFSSITCAAIVLIVWGTLGKIWAVCQGQLCGLVVSFLIVLAYALLIPEPTGYPNAGKLRITAAEFIFGILNTFIVFSAASGLKAF
jgi:hypothetical protein